MPGPCSFRPPRPALPQRLAALAIAAALLIPAAAAHAQQTQTQAPCSPVIDRTQGNVTVTFSGGCTAGIAQADIEKIVESVLARNPVPPDLLDCFVTLSKEFGVTETALATFFRILGENKVRTEDLDARLREIAARHVALLRHAEASPDDNPQVAAVKMDAVAAIIGGDYDRAETLLLLQHCLDQGGTAEFCRSRIIGRQ